MDSFPDIVPAKCRPIVIEDDTEFVHDPADFNLASSLLVESDSELKTMVTDESLLMNATLREIDFQPDTE